MKNLLIVCFALFNAIALTAKVDAQAPMQTQVQQHSLGFPSSNRPVKIGVPFGNPQLSKIALAKNLLAKAKTEEEKESAMEEIRSALSKEFEADVKSRESELATIKSRFEKMEATLQKRVSLKDDIIELRLQVMVNEFEGLGWMPVPLSAPRSQPSSAPFRSSINVSNARRK